MVCALHEFTHIKDGSTCVYKILTEQINWSYLLKLKLHIRAHATHHSQWSIQKALFYTMPENDGIFNVNFHKSYLALKPLNGDKLFNICPPQSGILKAKTGL
jgi:hypothetical protein